MPLIFSQYRTAGTVEAIVTRNRVGNTLPRIEVMRHDENKEINSIKVEIIDNKPLYIPLGRSGQTYKIQFKTFDIKKFNAWYTVLGNDVLEVIMSDYAEFPVDSFWVVESFTSAEVIGSAYACMSDETAAYVPRGTQPIIMEYELEVSQSITDALGRPRV